MRAPPCTARATWITSACCSFDAKGKPVREQRFLGLYTSSAYNRRPWDIPLVRERYEHVMRESGLRPASHSGKALRHIMESLPRDELFQSTEAELFDTATGILGLQERVRSKLFLRRDRYGRFYSVLVYVPRDRHDTHMRHRIEAMLKDALDGEHVDTTVHIGESPLAQLHMIVRPRAGSQVQVDEAEARSRTGAHRPRLAGRTRPNNSAARHGEEQRPAARRALRPRAAGRLHRGSQPGGRRDRRRTPRRADRPRRPAPVAVSLAQRGGLRFKFYRLNDDIPLSDALPMMENMGLRVISEHPYRIECEATRSPTSRTSKSRPRRPTSTSSRLDENFEEAFARIWRGEAENDAFNRLVLSAGLSWRQVAMLRGYCKYILQTGVPFSQSYVEATFSRYPLLVRLLVELFEARFDPCTGIESKAAIKQGMERFGAQLQALLANDAAAHGRGAAGDRSPRRHARAADRRHAHDVAGPDGPRASLDDDRILRSFIGVIDATLRTSYFIQYANGVRKDGGPADYISFKFDSAKVPDLPKPRPYREIFVYGPRVEGVHLRFGPVARGGLRWSDRREDFRTEVLGLVKAQMVKNTVIVPVGSKGGFFCKQLPDPAVNRDAWFNEGVACYQRFINGLLDITDNLAPDGKIVHPANVVRHDADDPYLVVAADKGTATFSDIANGIARAHGFWLDDAFASGGSVGYDHKGMGITARGAWESVKRHFRAMGRDSPDAGLHRRRHRRHVRRRVRQRHAAVEAHPPAGRVRPPPHLPRPEPGCGAHVQGTRAHVQAAAFELGRLRQVAHQQGRRRVPAQREVDPGLGRKSRPRWASKADVDGDEPDGADVGDPQGAGRPAVERRHRHVREVLERNPCRRRRPRQQRPARQRRGPALQAWWARAATWA